MASLSNPVGEPEAMAERLLGLWVVLERSRPPTIVLGCTGHLGCSDLHFLEKMELFSS